MAGIADDALPSICLTMLSANTAGQRIAAIRRGEGGYYVTDYDRPDMTAEQAQALVDELNRKLGVSPEQQTTMVLRSMGTWPLSEACAARAVEEPSAQRTMAMLIPPSNPRAYACVPSSSIPSSTPSKL